MSTILQEQQCDEEGFFDLSSNKTSNFSSINSNKNASQFNIDMKIRDLKNNQFLKNKKNISSEEKFQNSLISTNISIKQAPQLFCQTLLDDEPQESLKNPIATLPQPDLNRISHLFQVNQKDFLVKEIPDGYLQHQSTILHYHSKCNQNSTKIDNRIKTAKNENNNSIIQLNQIKSNLKEEEIKNENKIQINQSNPKEEEFKDLNKVQLNQIKVNQNESQNEIGNFYKEKYMKAKEKYKKAKQIIASLQSQLQQKSLQQHQQTNKIQKSVQTQKNHQTNEFRKSQEVNENLTQKASNNEQIVIIKKRYKILKEEYDKSKIVIENQNKQIFQLQNKISQLLINNTNTTEKNYRRNQNFDVDKTNNEHFLIAKKARLHFKGKIKSRSKSLSRYFHSPSRNVELSPHPIKQYEYLCHMLNVKSDEFDQQWNKVFRKIADLLNSYTALKQSSSCELDLLKKRNDDLSKKISIFRLSSRFGSLISNFNSNMYKELEDLHSSITKKNHSHFRELILAVIFTNRMINIINFNSFINEKSLKIFNENPIYSPQVLIGEIRSSFTTLSQDLVYAQSIAKKKSSKI